MYSKDQNAILRVEEMGQADQMTIHAGTSGATLMEAAGFAVTRHIMGHYKQTKTLVLCGPGNNGGDGFVVARHLKRCGWEVDVMLLGKRENLKGDAAIMADMWDGPCLAMGLFENILDYKLVVDALFGTGLCRPVEGEVATLIERINALCLALALNVVAVDIPSGIDGNNGQILGVAFNARSTVTFFRKKIGHFLYPGRGLCGDIMVVDIGIAERVLISIKPEIFRNDPALWLEQFPHSMPCSHKYNRGYGAVVSGGVAQSGAARLAARAALRIGAGLVSVVCPQDAILAHACQLTAVMIKPFLISDSILGDSKSSDIGYLLEDSRINGWCIGPGCGVNEQTKSRVLAILRAGRQCVIDADGLMAFIQKPEILFEAIKESGQIPILTPHAGEFSCLFPDLIEKEGCCDKLLAVRKAVIRAGAVIIFKGADTVIASPCGRVVINDNAPPQLATAGAGDVLSGLCLGLLTQKMPPFEAACAAVWIHGACANAFGLGLIAEDIEEKIPKTLKYLSRMAYKEVRKKNNLYRKKWLKMS